MVIHTLFILNHQAETLKTLVEMADRSTAAPGFRAQELAVNWETSPTDSTMIDFEGFDYKSIKSDLTGYDWFIYDNTKPLTMRLPFFNKSIPSAKIKLPQAYIIPAEWSEVIKRLKLHGVKMDTLTAEIEIKVGSYKFRDYEFRKLPNEGRQMVNTGLEEIEETRIFPKGSAVIYTNQRTAKVIAGILEPAATGSFVEWGFFNAIFEQKEYSETYVMEKMAREMLQNNPQMRQAFEKKKKDNPEFAKSQWDMLNWFYAQTPYWDQEFLKYPVGKISEATTLSQVRRISVPSE